MRNFVRWTDEKALPDLLILNWSIALQPDAATWSDQELAKKIAQVPTPERREAWSRIARRPYTDEERQHALDKLLLLLVEMRKLLDHYGGPWLLGENYSLADIAAAPFIARIAELTTSSLDADAVVRAGGHVFSFGLLFHKRVLSASTQYLANVNR